MVFCVNALRLWQKTLIKVLYKEIHIIASYRIVLCNKIYREDDVHDDRDREKDCRKFELTCLYNVARYTLLEGVINVVLRSIHEAIIINNCQRGRERKRQSCDSQVTN